MAEVSTDIGEVAKAAKEGFSFGEALVALITKAMPSDEQKLQAFKARYPRIYARNRKWLLINAFHYLKHHNGTDIEKYINFVNGDLTEDERKNMEDMLRDQLGK